MGWGRLDWNLTRPRIGERSEMKFLLLVIITTWSFGGGGIWNLPQKEIVGSPQQAAIIIYQNEQRKEYPEPDQHRYELYEVDLENNKIRQIAIPMLKFEPQTKAETPGKE